MMERYHGTGWRDALDEQEAEVAEAERELGEKNDEEELLAEKPETATKGLGADPSGSPSRELVERLRSLQGAGTVSGATSLASGGGAVVDQLRRKLAEPYDPSMESLDRYQKRVRRVAEALEMSGEFVDATEIAVLLMRAEIQDSLKGLGRDEQLRQLKLRFAQQLVDGADGEEEREVRLSTLLTMEERGGKLSGKKEKLFSGSDLSPAKEVPKSQALGGLEVATAKAKPESLERPRSGAVPLLSGALGGPSSPPGAEGACFPYGADQGGGGGSEKSRWRRAKPRSTIQISPKVT